MTDIYGRPLNISLTAYASSALSKARRVLTGVRFLFLPILKFKLSISKYRWSQLKMYIELYSMRKCKLNQIKLGTETDKIWVNINYCPSLASNWRPLQTLINCKHILSFQGSSECSSQCSHPRISIPGLTYVIYLGAISTLHHCLCIASGE